MTSPIPLKGRTQELTTLAPLLAQQGITLVLEGPPGVGKSRLMEELQKVYQHNYPTHTTPQWISLVEAYTIEDLLNAITQGLQIRAPAQWVDPLQQGLDLFEAAPCGLLMFDNCEQLQPPARDLLRKWRSAKPIMRWCLTSQENLGLDQETRHPLSPLPCPDTDASLEEIQQNPSVQLLHTLVHWRRGQYTPNEQEWRALGLMARQVDGIPLGLTMAAGRMTLLDAGQVKERINKDVGVLRASPGLQDAHHTTMRAVLERTLSRLSPSHQELWVQLSVFQGGFDVEAAEGIAQLTSDNTTLNILEELEHRFLLRNYTHQEKQRLELFQLMLQLARQEAQALGQWEDLKNRHATWFAQQGIRRSLMTNNNAQAIAWILRERRNLEAARVHMKTLVDAQPHHVERVTQYIWLTITLSMGQRRSARYSTSANFLLETLDTTKACWDNLSPRWRAFLLMQVFNHRIFHDQLPKAPLEYHKEALSLAMQTDDAMLKASLWNAFGTYHIDITPNAQLAQQGIRNAFQCLIGVKNTDISRAKLAINLAVLERVQGLFHEAMAHLKEAIKTFQEHGFKRSQCNALINLSLSLSQTGDHKQACASLEQAIQIATEINNIEQKFAAAVRYIHILAQGAPLLDNPHTQLAQAQVQALNFKEEGQNHSNTPSLQVLEYNLIEVSLTQGHYEQAFTKIESQIVQLDEERSKDSTQAHMLTGICYLLQARWQDARDHLQKVQQQAREDHDIFHQRIVQCWLVLASQGQGQHQRAQNLLHEAKLLERPGYPLEDACYQFTHSVLLLHRAQQEDTEEAWKEGLQTLAMSMRPLPGHAYTAFHCNLDMRLLLRNLLTTLPPERRATLWAYALDPDQQRLIIDSQAMRFRPPGKTWVDLDTHPVLARLLLLLVKHPEGLSTQDLIDHLYPDEMVLYEAGVNRIHKSLSLLRKKGLKPWIKQRQRRYIIAPEAQTVFAPPIDTWWER